MKLIGRKIKNIKLSTNPKENSVKRLKKIKLKRVKPKEPQYFNFIRINN